MRVDTAQIIQQSVPIQGIPVEIIEDDKLKDDGVYYPYLRQIHIKPEHLLLDDDATNAEKQARYQEVLRHELMHAFFSLSGLDHYSNDEVLVDFIAVLYPRIKEAFKKAGCNDDKEEEQVGRIKG